MNIVYEFSKVKDAFKKVKTDMDIITDKIHENYDNFLQEHKLMQENVHNLSNELKKHLDYFKSNHLENIDAVPKKEILEIKNEISQLKEELSQTFRKTAEFNDLIFSINDNTSQIKDLKEKIHSNELEIYLLKERLVEKDLELTKMKDTSKHLLDIIDELSRAELDLLNKTA